MSVNSNYGISGGSQQTMISSNSHKDPQPSWEDRYASLKKQFDTLTQQNDKLHVEICEGTSVIIALTEENTALHNTPGSLETALKLSGKENDTLFEENQKLRDDIEGMEQRLHDILDPVDKLLNQLRMENANLKNENRLLTGRIVSYEGRLNQNGG